MHKVVRDGGSSPRMRGARNAESKGGIGSGIIPADAGSTRPSAGRASHGRDHPRGCGEHEQLADRVMRGEGSSPRMRGALYATLDDLRQIGIIPADAGSTSLPTL